jgi:hypothetical protein
MQSSRMMSCVDFVRAGVSEENIAFIIKAKKSTR